MVVCDIDCFGTLMKYNIELDPDSKSEMERKLTENGYEIPGTG